ncbi:MAG: 30S ribosomal protein S16 [Minisyncoccia bacterium]
MLNIRLQRVGRKNDPSFRVIVADSKLKPKTGNFIEVLGSYNARMGKPIINLDRTKYWMSVGAKASGTVHNLLIDLKAVTGKKINVLGRKTPIVKEKAGEAPKVEAKAPVAVETETPVAEVAEEVVAEDQSEVTAEATEEVSPESTTETPKAE